MSSRRTEGGGRPTPQSSRVYSDDDDDRSRSATPVQGAGRPARKSKQCPDANCDGTGTIEDAGQIMCAECGAVISEVQLAQDVQFGEAANGQAIVQGVHVGEGQETARAAPGSSRIMGGTASKEMAIADARREMVRLAAHPGWGIKQSDVEKAERVFKLAYSCGHTKSRDRLHICAVCLYIAVRQRPDDEPTLMLIDFADFVKVSVFYLGRLYTELCQAIRINHEATVYQIRPELLAHRFCEDLGFGDDTFRIATEAVNIVKRMNRDWLVRGRRPSGIVGAAVILAARMNNYRRTVRELVYTAKVCEYTITKRLDEFKCTPISKLTVKEVRSKTWEQAAPEAVGPPALYPGLFSLKRKRKRSKAAQSDGQASQVDGPRPVSAGSNAETHSEGTDGRTATLSQQGRPKKAKGSRVAASGNQTQAEADRQAMPPPSESQLNIDPELLRASSQALRDIGDEENAALLSRNRQRRHEEEDADDHDGDADEEGNSASRKRHRRKKRLVRPLPEPSLETIADEAELEADMNAHLEDADMLAQAGPAHEEAANAPQPPSEDEDYNGDEATAPTSPQRNDHVGKAARNAQEVALENNFLKEYLGIFHPKRDEYEDYDDDDEESQHLPASEQWTSHNHEDVHKAYKETVKHSREILAKYPTTTAELLAKVKSDEEISDSEFADDPEVNDMILTSPNELKVKEALWISKYGKYLKERHLKAVQKLIDAESGNVKQPRRRDTKKPRPGDDSGYARDGQGRVGTGWRGAIKATFEHRGSNKLNYEAIGKILDADSPNAGSGTATRSGSVAPSVTGNSLSRQSTPSIMKPVRMPRLPKDGKIPEVYAKRLSTPLNPARSPAHSPEVGTNGRKGATDKGVVEDQRGEEADDDDGDYVQGRNAYEEDDDDEDEMDEDDDGMPEMSDLAPSVLARLSAGMTLEEAIAAEEGAGF